MFRKAVTVSRVGSKTFDARLNEWVGSGDSEFSVLASVQPLSAREAAASADVTQGRQAYKLYLSPDQPLLRPVEEKNTADHVTVAGKTFEVVTREDFLNDVIPHRRYIVRSMVPLAYSGGVR